MSEAGQTGQAAVPCNITLCAAVGYNIARRTHFEYVNTSLCLISLPLSLIALVSPFGGPVRQSRKVLDANVLRGTIVRHNRIRQDVTDVTGCDDRELSQVGLLDSQDQEATAVGIIREGTPEDSS